MTLRDDYCKAVQDSVCLYEHWMEGRDWWSIELTHDEINNLDVEAAMMGITIAPCEELPCEEWE